MLNLVLRYIRFSKYLNISIACVKTFFKLINIETDIGTRVGTGTLALFNKIVFNIPTSK
jgi:hypothetical protein